MSDLRTLDDRYELGDVLGRGGMAEVRRGMDLRLGRRVAVKTLRLDLTQDATFQARFRREAQSAAALNHPSIVAVYDTGEDVLDGQRVPYIVMEYVEGVTLRDLLHDPDVRITHERALEITAGVLDALEYSHRAGIVHRDIKPANVMVTSRGEVKVMDFGIARALADAGATMTQTAAVVGTAQYLSPEQARGEQADARSDLYSTGCLLYELLTGRPPFLGDSLVSVAVAHVREQPERPSTHDPSIPREVDAIVMMALAKDREERYQSADEMRADIERVLAGLPLSAAATGATQLIPAAVPLRDEGPAPFEPPAEEERRRGNPWVLIAVLGLLALIVAAAVGFLVFREPATKQVQIPGVIGKTRQVAQAELQKANMKPLVNSVNDTEAPRGEVTDQSPSGGTFKPEGTTVTITVSLGAKTTSVPALTGITVRSAERRLTAVGLRLGQVNPQDSPQPRDQVLSSQPGPGTEVPLDTAVDLNVSSGQVQLPSVVGRDSAAAEVELRNLGLRPDVRDRPDRRATPGTIVEQVPGAGQIVSRGDTVILYAATPEPTSPPPTTPSGSPSTSRPAPSTSSPSGSRSPAASSSSAAAAGG